MNTPNSQDVFTIERHGELTLISATPALETLEFGLEEHAADLIMEPFRHQENPLVVFDLSQVDYFGSMFLALLLRCWKLVQARGGMMVLAGVSDPGQGTAPAHLARHGLAHLRRAAARRWKRSWPTDSTPDESASPLTDPPIRAIPWRKFSVAAHFTPSQSRARDPLTGMISSSDDERIRMAEGAATAGSLGATSAGADHGNL